ncbi:MAG: Ldh family oxidoreductase [Dinoroseobacter sp.]|nr:Ldh family oxidoreductase [Dinoroseobacter sp.]
MKTVPVDTLKRFASDCLEAAGVSAPDAALVADTLVQADLWGHPSHGVLRLFWYIRRIQSGATKINVSEGSEQDPPPALSVLDGQDGLGQVVAHRAMRRAIAAARAHGIGAVAVHSSGHFGMAMYYSAMAAAEGCVGYICANASPAMAPVGGREKRIGTNPLSWGAPAGAHAPFLLDYANTAVARGKLYDARAKGHAVPEGWAIDSEGRSTTDPHAGIAGTILPMAGHKGYGMALAVDLLSGVLSGSAFGSGITGPYVPKGRSGAGHFVLAIDIAAVRPLAEFEADMEQLIAELKATPRAAGVDEIYYPGELESHADVLHRRVGVTLPAAVLDELREGAKALDVPFPF